MYRIHQAASKKWSSFSFKLIKEFLIDTILPLRPTTNIAIVKNIERASCFFLKLLFTCYKSQHSIDEVVYLSCNAIRNRCLANRGATHANIIHAYHKKSRIQLITFCQNRLGTCMQGIKN